MGRAVRWTDDRPADPVALRLTLEPLRAGSRAFQATDSSRRQALVIGGPYSELCDQVLLNALALRRDRPLRGLTLVFVAPEPPSASVTAAASAASARLFHRRLR